MADLLIWMGSIAIIVAWIADLILWIRGDQRTRLRNATLLPAGVLIVVGAGLKGWWLVVVLGAVLLAVNSVLMVLLRRKSAADA